MKISKTFHKPVFIHVKTINGKGYTPAEQNPCEYHIISKIKDNIKCEFQDSYSNIFGQELVHLGLKDERICAITAAMKYGTCLHYFSKCFHDRFYDVGISEQHAVTFAGGLAMMKQIPIFVVYSTFLQRTYDQLIHDVAISRLHIVLGIDRAGIVGEDGETHQGLFDVSIYNDLFTVQL